MSAPISEALIDPIRPVSARFQVVLSLANTTGAAVINALGDSNPLNCRILLLTRRPLRSWQWQ